ncbi:MAG: hypothetical protein JXA60_01705 [Candidatus Coatesbacteria bacterium]|nr:hypothetical protein [Candidatus Coatesbacteria bacterium]
MAYKAPLGLTEQAGIEGEFVAAKSDLVEIFIEKSLYLKVPDFTSEIKFHIQGYGMFRIKFKPSPKSRQFDNVEFVLFN